MPYEDIQIEYLTARVQALERELEESREHLKGLLTTITLLNARND